MDGAAPKEIAIEALPDILDIARVPADNMSLHGLLNARDHSLRTSARNALAPAINPLIGLDLKEDPARLYSKNLEPGYPHADAPPKVMRLGGVLPCFTAMTFVTAVSPIRWFDSYVVPATCGVMTTFGKSKSSSHAGGSKS